MFKLFIIVSLVFLVGGCRKNDDSHLKTYQLGGKWEKNSSIFPIPEPNNAVSFQIGDAFYFGLGSTYDGKAQQLFFKFTREDGWKILGEFPGKGREYATAFVLDGKAYVGLGYLNFVQSEPEVLTDFWKYDPLQNSWDSLQIAFPNEGRWGAVAFTQENKAYVGTGATVRKEDGYVYLGDFCEFSSEYGWRKADGLTVNPRSYATAFGVYDDTYLCFGENNNNPVREILKLSENSLSWVNMQSLKPMDYPDIPSRVSSFILNKDEQEYVFVYGANPSVWCYTYNLQKDVWLEVSDFPKVNTCFVIRNTLYMLNGINTYHFIQD